MSQPDPAPLDASERARAEAAAGRVRRHRRLLAALAGFDTAVVVCTSSGLRPAVLGAAVGLIPLLVRRPRPHRRLTAPDSRWLVFAALMVGSGAGLARGLTTPPIPEAVAGPVAVRAVVEGWPRRRGGVETVQLAITDASSAGLVGASLPVTVRADLQPGDVVEGGLRGASGHLSAVRMTLVRRDRSGIGGRLVTLRAFLVQALHATLPPPEGALGAGVLFGVREALPGTLDRDLQSSGLVHLLVTSGLKVSLVGGLAGRMARAAGGSAPLAALTVGSGYAILAGGGVAALRAALMAGLVAGAVALGRPVHALTSLLLAIAAVAMLDPRGAGSPGFSLTFAGTAGVLLFTGPLLHRLRFLPPLVAEPLALTLGATALSLPLVLSAFHHLSVWSPLASVAVFPLLPVTMLSVLVSGIGGMAPAPVGQLLSLPAWGLLRWVELVAQAVGASPGDLAIASIPPAGLALYYAVAAWLAGRLPVGAA